jgi:hypothetical protein
MEYLELAVEWRWRRGLLWSGDRTRKDDLPALMRHRENCPGNDFVPKELPIDSKLYL